MSVEEWNAGPDKMNDQHSSHLTSQADFLPTSSQSPGNSPQPSPDSQQKDLGAATPTQLQSQQKTLQLPKAAVSQHSHFTEQRTQQFSSQQDHQVSQSDLAASKSPTFLGSSLSVSSGLDTNTHKLNQPLPQGSSGGNTRFSSQGVHKIQQPSPDRQKNHQQQQLSHNVTHNTSQQVHPKLQTSPPQRLPQPRQPSPQKPSFKANPPALPHPQAMRMPAQSNSGNPAGIQQRPTGPAMQNFSRAPHYKQYRQEQHPPQTQQKMPPNQFQQMPNSAAGNSQRIGQGHSMVSPRFFPPKQTQQVRPQTVHRPSFQNRPLAPHHVEMKQPRIPYSNQNSSPARLISQQDRSQVFQHNVNTHDRDTGAVDSMDYMPEDEMYEGDYEAAMQEEEMYPEDYEGEEEEDYDEEMMDEEDYSYSGPGYGYESSGSDDLSEEESSLFEQLTHLDPSDQRYEDIVNRLREKGVDRDEIDEIINPQRLDYSQMYGGENQEHGDEEDEEDRVSSSSLNQGEKHKQVPTSQQAVIGKHGSVPPSRSIQQVSPSKSLVTSPVSGPNIRGPTEQQSSQGLSQSGLTQQQQSVPPPTHSQQQQSFHQPLSQGQPQRAQVPLSSQQHPGISVSSSSAHTSIVRPNWQPSMATSVSRFSQPKKVFQSPVQTCSSTTMSEPSDLQSQQKFFSSSESQQHQPRPSTPIKPTSSSSHNQQIINAPRQIAPNHHMTGTLRHGGPNQTGANMGRSPLMSTLQGGHTFRSQAPSQHVAVGQGAQVQQFQQRAVIQPPMVRAVAPRTTLHQQRMTRPGLSPQAVHRPHFSQLGPLRPRIVSALSYRPQRPIEPARVPVPINQATQSRLEVQRMQDMLDKQILAKKGVASLPGQTSVTPLSQSTENQSLASHSSLSSSNPHVFQAPQPRQYLPPRRPIGGAAPLGRHPNFIPKRPVAPSGAQPIVPRFGGSVRPRKSAPLSQQRAPFSQQTPLAPQNRMAPPLQAGMPVQGPNPGKPAVLLQGLHSGADPNRATIEHQQTALLTPQPATSKPASFSLEDLKEDQCKIPEGRNLVINKIYGIKSPIDQSLIYAVWNGEKFENINPDSAKGSNQPSTSSAPLQQSGSQPKTQDTAAVGIKAKTPATPVGGNAFQEEFLHSLQASSAKLQDSSSSEPGEPDTNFGGVESQPSQSDKSEAAQEKVAQSSSQTTFVKPLPPAGPTQQKKACEEEEDEDDDSIFKKPFSENDDVFRVCNNCGYTSKNFKRCDGCKKLFQGEVKIHCIKKTSAASEPPTSASSSKQEMKPSDRFREVMSKASFYGIKDVPQRGGRGRGLATARRGLGRTKGGGLKGKEETEADHHSSDEESDEKKGGAKKRPGRPKGRNVAPRKRSKKTDEPVTVTISSDEDEPSSTSNMFPGFSPSPARSAGSESPIFPTAHTNPVNAFGRFRRVCMEDEEGHSKLQKKLQQQTQSETSAMLRGEEELEEDDDEDGDDPAVYQIDIRSVRIGSMRTQPEEPMLISLHGVCFRCRSERTEEEFECEILCQEVEHVKFFAGQPQPVLFLFLTQECGEKLRSICHMENGDEEYFDPSSTDMKQKMVVIIIESFNEMPLEMLRENLTLWADMNHQEDQDYLEELSEESANDLLIQSAPPVLTADVERSILKFKKEYIHDSDGLHVRPRRPASPSENMDSEEPDSTSSSPPDVRHHFYGPPIRLLLYPPPPARGISITTEDLMCLAEGEFLNDVVIDFYLQYLYKEKLSEENQKRTHIFSSFFYKRLTQRDRHSEKTQEDAKKSLQEKRHARVQKWTKTVDLFGKDFIIVPINEHSHWYLAVICFPGLEGPEVVPYIPSSAHTADVDEMSNDAGSAEGGSSSKDKGNSSQENVLKHTVLGRQLEGDECNKSDEGKLIGQRQPCILMFDSLAGPSRNPNVKMLREYLQCEWNAKKSEPRQIAKIVRGSTPKVPQQSNYSDCGVFLLQYVESFFEDPIADFQIPMKGLQNWFPEELVLHKRREIHELIMGLHQTYMEERGDPRVLDIPFESTPRRLPPPPPMDKSNPNNHEHFLGKLEEGAGAGGGGGNKDEDSSNSSAAWEMAAPSSPPFPVALRQNAMFDREESSQSPLLPGFDFQRNEEEEEGDCSEKEPLGFDDQRREEYGGSQNYSDDKDTEGQQNSVHHNAGVEAKDTDAETSGEASNLEGNETAFEELETEMKSSQDEKETDKKGILLTEYGDDEASSDDPTGPQAEPGHDL